jgi:hypothetical protein
MSSLFEVHVDYHEEPLDGKYSWIYNEIYPATLRVELKWARILILYPQLPSIPTSKDNVQDYELLNHE